jgi:transcriptional regulator with XRE-family HTH domain
VVRRRAEDVRLDAEAEEKLTPALREFGARLRDARLNAGMTQQELAVKVRTAPSYIYELEGGLQNLTLKSMIKLALSLNVDVSDLLPGSESKPPTARALDSFMQRLDRLAAQLADLEVREGRRQELQASFIEQIRLFTDMRTSLQHLRIPPTEAIAPAIPPRKKGARKGSSVAPDE